jgi:hypothetical protein
MTLQILPKEARSADNSLYNNDLCRGMTVFWFPRKLIWGPKKLIWVPKKLVWGTCELFWVPRKLIWVPKKTGFSIALCFYTKNYRRFRAS